MLVLVVNAGSSSLKCQLIETDGKLTRMKCLAEKVGTDAAYMNVSFAPDFVKTRYDVAGKSVAECLAYMLDILTTDDACANLVAGGAAGGTGEARDADADARGEAAGSAGGVRDAAADTRGAAATSTNGACETAANGSDDAGIADSAASATAVTPRPASPIASLAQIDAIGNRIVAGGEYFSQATLIDDQVRANLEKCNELAPLHNPPACECIDMMRELMPGTPQVAVFDTAFHTTMPPKAYMYPLPMRFYREHHIRRYGAHGTSHRYAAQQAANLLGRPLQDLGLITCHLGNGGSITAVNHGQSIDTSMGFTPLEGLMMGTRSGSIDPAIITFLMRKEGLSFDEMDAILNRESGVLGISGRSADMRDVLEAADRGDEDSQLAIDMYVYRVQKTIGSYYAAMTRTDAVVMTAGIGENSAALRERIFAGLAHMGMILDKERNDIAGQIGMNRIISIDDSPIKICIVTTDEEMRIARETDNLVSQL